jgi:hypothetical protein
MSDVFPTSPNLPVNDRDVVRTPGEFSRALTLELTDDEIKRALQVTVPIVNKHQTIWRTKYPFDSLEQVADLLEELEKELSYRLMEEVDCLVRVDATPVFEGQAPVIEWLGKVEGTSLDRYGMDHEKKTYEVQKAEDRGEEFLGQKDNYRSQ